MADLNGFPHASVEFTKDGAIFEEAQVQGLLDTLQAATATDVVVLVHGWNNDKADATALYDGLTRQFRARLDSRTMNDLAQRHIVVATVFWPSKKFTDPELIPGGGAAALQSLLTPALLDEQIDVMKSLFEGDGPERALSEAQSLTKQLATSSDARKRFVDLLRPLLPQSFSEEDGDAIPGSFGTSDGSQLLEQLSQPLLAPPPAPGTGGAAMMGAMVRAGQPGGAASLGDLLGGVVAGAQRLMNLVTYYQMKERAGSVGVKGLNDVLRRVQREGLRLHLVGHSFGGRLVTAAAAGPTDQPAVPIASLSLLQAAFSQFGFADQDGKNGFFRRMVSERHVRGPVIITHSIHDKAVGLAYPIASRLAHQNASKLGDATDPYGGIGRNGAQKTTECRQLQMLAPGTPYALSPGILHNLQADDMIQGHSDIQTPQVAHAVLSAIAAAP